MAVRKFAAEVLSGVIWMLTSSLEKTVPIGLSSVVGSLDSFQYAKFGFVRNTVNGGGEGVFVPAR